MSLWLRRTAALTAATIVLLAGCTPAPTGGSATQPTQPKPDVPQKLVWGSGLFVPSLHPYISLSGTQRRYDMYDTLVGQAADGSVQPAIGKSWKSIDQLTWDIAVRTDLKFHNGQALTVEDIKFSAERAIDPAKKYAITARMPAIDKVTIVDPATVRISTKTPDPLFLKRIAVLSVLPKAYLEQVGDEAFQNQPIGSGPFKVVEFKDLSHVRLAAFPEHPYRKPTLQEVMIRNIPEASARIAGLKSGELDIADQMPIDQGPTLESAGFRVIANDTGSSEGYTLDTMLNEQPTPLPTRDKRVRQAMNYAVDKDSIVKNLYKGYTKAEQCQVVQAESFGFNPRLKPYPYDPKKAKELLAAAGYPNGFKIDMKVRRTGAETEPVALFVQSQLKEVGIDTEFTLIGDAAVYRDMFYGVQNRPGIFRMGLTNRPALDSDFALVWFAGNQTGGGMRYNNPEFDKAFLASQSEMNEQKRLELLQKANEIFCEDPPYLFLVQFSELVVAKKDIEGVVKRVDREQDLSVLKRS